MGVRGLETFVEKTFPSEACHEVNIRQLVEDFRRKRNADIKPIIAFHWSNISRDVLKDIDWVCGGQSEEALTRIENFIRAFTRVGAHPVFFFRGYSNVDADYFNRDRWIQRGLRRLENVNSFFDALRYGDPIPEGNPSSDVPYLQNLSYYFPAKFNCEVYKATRECNAEMVLYVRRNENCIAIFGQDSDFLIHGAAPYYLSSKHFDINTMKTRNYSKAGLANLLELPEWQLPLFGTLAGRDNFTSFEELLPFFKELTGGPTPVDRRFRALARYIRNRLRLPGNVEEQFQEETMRRILPRVARDTLNDAEAETLFLISIQNYRPKEDLAPVKSSFSSERVKGNLSHWDEIMVRAEELHRSNKIPALVRKILQNQPFEYLPALEDLRKNSTTNLPASALMTRPLREQLYKILLAEKPEPHPLLVTEYSMEGYDTANEPVKISIDAFQEEHPGLMKLWSDNRSDELQRKRWTLFVAAASPRLDRDKLENLPTDLILPTMTLVYLRDYDASNDQGTSLADREICAIIAMVVLLKKSLNESRPSHISPRAVHIASIFNRTLYTIMDLLAVCGYPLSFPETFSFPYFDGKLFQRKYQEAMTGTKDRDLCQNENDVIEKFEAVRAIVFEDV